jgi:hypothetical protein
MNNHLSWRLPKSNVDGLESMDFKDDALYEARTQQGVCVAGWIIYQNRAKTEPLYFEVKNGGGIYLAYETLTAIKPIEDHHHDTSKKGKN